MIDALISGRLFAAATERTSSNGNPYVVAKVTAPIGSESIFVNVVAFSQTARTALLALDAGDTVALAGELAPGAYTDKSGDPKPTLNMRAHQVLTAYHVNRKRKAVRPDEQHETHQRSNPVAPAPRPGPLDFGDMEDDL
ncbi:MAG: single-stranded DNA-binding protein [Betaproteobacteria bacterium]|nr:single-stranded DNA-binding protein [Betaproteobacteria bacterium]